MNRIIGNLYSIIPYGERLPHTMSKFDACMKHVARGLTFLHSLGIVHGRVNCSNVLYIVEGTSFVWKLSDFGIETTGAALSELAQFYQPDDQLRNRELSTYADDVYAFGMVISNIHHVIANKEQFLDNMDLVRFGRMPRLRSYSKKFDDLISGMVQLEVRNRIALDDVTWFLEKELKFYDERLGDLCVELLRSKLYKSKGQ